MSLTSPSALRTLSHKFLCLCCSHSRGKLRLCTGSFFPKLHSSWGPGYNLNFGAQSPGS